jgi:hypothetical protein
MLKKNYYSKKMWMSLAGRSIFIIIIIIIIITNFGKVYLDINTY